MYNNRRGNPPDKKAPCKFYAQGNCRFGARCNYSHDTAPGSNAGNSFQSNNNRNNNFGGNNNNQNNFGNNNRQNNNNVTANNFRNTNSKLGKKNPYLLDKDAIADDLTAGREKPGWPLSAYGPGRDAPLQLIEGPDYEISPEELRYKCYLLRAQGQFQQYAAEEAMLQGQAQNKVDEILRNTDNAIEYVIEGANKDTSRLRGVQDSGNFPPNVQSSFGNPSQIAQPSGLATFGHTSHPNQNPAIPQSFGQPSAFQPPKQPAAMGGRPSFGQPSLVNSGASAFNKPPAQPSFGQPSQPTSTFGQPSQPSFGQPSQPAFGQPSQPAFGQPSQPTSTFGQPSQPQAPQPNNALQSQQVPSFGQPSATSSGLAQPTPSTAAPNTSESKSAAEGPPEAYEGALGETLKGIYQAVYEGKGFPDGVVPEIPPKREWIRF